MSRFVPLTELTSEQSPAPRIDWQLPSPYVEGDEVGVDVRGFERIMGIIGLSGVTIRGYQGDRTEYKVESTGVTGINGGGSPMDAPTATGTAVVSATKAAIQKSEFLDGDSERPWHARRPWAAIDINRAELGQRVAAAVERGATREQAYASEVDKAIRIGLLGVAVKALIKEPLRQKHASRFLNSINALNYALGILKLDPVSIGIALVGAAMLNPLRIRLYNMSHTDQITWGDVKLGLFVGGFMPERLPFAAAEIAMPGLVRRIKRKR